MLGFMDFFKFFFKQGSSKLRNLPKGIIKFKALLTARCLFCNIPAYPNSLYLISAPFRLTLIKSGLIAYQVLSCVCVLPPQQRKLTFKLISLSLDSSVLIRKGVQKYLFNWIKSLTFSHESGAARRKSNKHNFKRTEHKNHVMIIRTVSDLQFPTRSYNRKPLLLHWKYGLALELRW